MFSAKSECSAATVRAGHELLISSRHDSTITSGMFFLLKPLGAKLLKNQEESLKDMNDHQMLNTLGEKGGCGEDK